MIGIQIIAVSFSLVMVYFSYLYFRRGEFKKLEYYFWLVLWLGLILVTLRPSSLDALIEALSISRVFDFVVVVGIIVVFGISFRNYIIVRGLEKKLEEFTRQESLKKIGK